MFGQGSSRRRLERKGVMCFRRLPHPLEAMDMLCSRHASERWRNGAPLEIAFFDARKAYFNALPTRNIHLQFPPELGIGGGVVGKLRRRVYGCRDAGMLWEECYAKNMVGMGFIRGQSPHCCFRHPARHLMAVVHGDDFTILGVKEEPDGFEQELAKGFELKLRRSLGTRAGCV